MSLTATAASLARVQRELAAAAREVEAALDGGRDRDVVPGSAPARHIPSPRGRTRREIATLAAAATSVAAVAERLAHLLRAQAQAQASAAARISARDHQARQAGLEISDGMAALPPGIMGVADPTQIRARGLALERWQVAWHRERAEQARRRQSRDHALAELTEELDAIAAALR